MHLKFLHLILGVFIVGFLAIGALLYMSETQKEGSQKRTQREVMKRESDFDNSSSIKEFLTKTGSVKCVFDDEDEATTVYINDGMVRADMTGDDDDENAGVIYSENTFYIWNTKSGQGVTGQVPDKISKLMDKETEKISEDDIEDLIENIQERADKCEDAEIVESMFTPPASIKFKTLSI